MDDETWAIRYIEVATRNWWPGKKVLFSPAWIQKVSWVDSKVYVGLYRDAIQTAPLFVDSVPLTREYEDRLYRHYGRPPYWVARRRTQACFLPKRRLSRAWASGKTAAHDFRLHQRPIATLNVPSGDQHDEQHRTPASDGRESS